MNMKKLFLLFLIISVSQLGHSQNYVLKVLANKGDNEIKIGSGKWKPLLTGAALGQGDQVKVSKDAYIGFLHYNGHALEWKKEGTFKVSEIEKTVLKTSSSLVSKYADFLASKSSEHSKSTASGGVHRGDSEFLHVFSPTNALVMNSEITISWEDPFGNSTRFKVLIKNMYDKILMEELSDTESISLNLSDEKFSGSNTILIQIEDANDEKITSAQVAITRLAENDLKALEDTFYKVSAGLDENSALGKYIMAGFYEESNLILDALNSLEEAIKLAPEVPVYKQAYNEFLLRNQLNIK
jgi:hypothetical protein